MIELQDELAWRLVHLTRLNNPVAIATSWLLGELGSQFATSTDQHRSHTFEGKLREPCAGYVGEISGSAMVLRGVQEVTESSRWPFAGVYHLSHPGGISIVSVEDKEAAEAR